MEQTQAYIVATLIVLLLLVVAAYVWVNYGNKWNTFNEAGGATVSFDAGSKTPAWIRFRNCKFTTQNPQGVAMTWDVTAVLNGMAVAHPKQPPAGSYPTSLSLSDELNPFSFIKAGFNDSQTVPTEAASQAWSSVPASSTKLTGEWTVLGGA